MSSVAVRKFEEVKMYGRVVGKCKCGKKRVRQRKFWMTLSPFNKNPDGSVRTRQDIYMALAEQIVAWEDEPITCEKCEAPRKQQAS